MKRAHDHRGPDPVTPESGLLGGLAERDSERDPLLPQSTRPVLASPLNPRGHYHPPHAGGGHRAAVGLSIVFISGAFYCVSSSLLILLNKHALSSFAFSAPNTLLLLHCLMAVALVKACEAVGWVQIEPLTWEIFKLWFPVNLIFVGMLVTSFFALKLIGARAALRAQPTPQQRSQKHIWAGLA